MDLGMAPYGFTPFCDSNKDMEGFRFWKKGYWADHLMGQPYHIRWVDCARLNFWGLILAANL
jgi:hypothetical protein